MKKKKFSFLIGIICILTLTVNAAAEYVYVNCDALNVRVSPNTYCDVVSTLPGGTGLEVIYADNGWYNIRMANGVTGFVSANYVSTAPVAASVGVQAAQTVQKYIGHSYSYGASGPNSFDCSGLTSYVYRQHGVSLPRSSGSQGSSGVYVAKTNLAAGDLVFFSNRGDRKINHVGIYVGDNKFVHAATSRRGVVMDNLTSSYYVNHYVTARRVV